MRPHIPSRAQTFHVWSIDVPLSPEETAADKAILESIDDGIPEDVTVLDMEVSIHGRKWRYQRYE